MTGIAPSVRSILVALDESVRAPLVFETAVMMARGLDAQLFLLCVLVIPPHIPPAPHSFSYSCSVHPPSHPPRGTHQSERVGGIDRERSPSRSARAHERHFRC